MKLKNSFWLKTQNSKLKTKKKKNQIVTKQKNSNCDNTQKLKL